MNKTPLTAATITMMANSIQSVTMTMNSSGYSTAPVVNFSSPGVSVMETDISIRRPRFNTIEYGGEIVPFNGIEFPRMFVEIHHDSYEYHKYNDPNPKIHDPTGMVCMIGTTNPHDSNEAVKIAYDDYKKLIENVLSDPKIIEAYNNFKVLQKLAEDTEF